MGRSPSCVNCVSLFSLCDLISGHRAFIIERLPQRCQIRNMREILSNYSRKYDTVYQFIYSCLLCSSSSNSWISPQSSQTADSVPISNESNSYWLEGSGAYLFQLFLHFFLHISLFLGPFSFLHLLRQHPFLHVLQSQAPNIHHHQVC